VRGTLVRAAPFRGLRLSARQAFSIEFAALLAVRALAVASAIPILLYLWVALHRLGYPYELDYLEGGAVGIVARVLHGQSLYTAPTLAYVSYTYPPLYSFVSAAVAELTGVGFLPLRLVSFVSSLFTLGLLWRWVRSVSGDWIAGVVAAGLFAATYTLSGWWFDVGRLDSLFLALTLAALVVGRSAQSWRGGLGFGLLAFLAFFTKQVALIALAPAMLILLLRRRQAGLTAIATAIVLVGGSTLALDAASHGWYRYFIVSELGGQRWKHNPWLGFWQYDLLRHFRPLVLLGLIALGVRLCSPKRQWSRALRTISYELAGAGGLLLCAWISRVHTGGYLNVLLPAFAACALLSGLAFASMRRRGPLLAIAAVAAIAIQLLILPYKPASAIPTATARAAGAQLMARLRSLPGPVLILAHPWYGTLAGKGSFAQSDAIAEVLRSHAPRGASELRAALRGSLNRYHVQAVVLDRPPQRWLLPQLRANFVLASTRITSELLRPVADLRLPPRYLYLRRH